MEPLETQNVKKIADHLIGISCYEKGTPQIDKENPKDHNM